MDATPSQPLFPLFLDLKGRRVLVVGGGKVAARKIEALLDAGAAVVVGAPQLEPALIRLSLQGRITHLAGWILHGW